MNTAKVQEILNSIVKETQDKYRRQYPVAKWQLAKLEELGLLELMPKNFEHGDAGAVIDQAEKSQGGFNAFGEGETWSTPLQRAMAEKEVVEEAEEDSAEEIVEEATDDYTEELKAQLESVEQAIEAVDKNSDDYNDLLMEKASLEDEISYREKMIERMHQVEERDLVYDVLHVFDAETDSDIDSVTVKDIEFNFDVKDDAIEMYIHASFVFNEETRQYVELDGSHYTIRETKIEDDETTTVYITVYDVDKAKKHLQYYPEQLPEKEWYTVAEMAEYCGVTKKSVYAILQDEKRLARELPCAYHTSPNNRRRGEWVIPGHLVEAWQRTPAGRK